MIGLEWLFPFVYTDNVPQGVYQALYIHNDSCLGSICLYILTQNIHLFPQLCMSLSAVGVGQATGVREFLGTTARNNAQRVVLGSIGVSWWGWSCQVQKSHENMSKITHCDILLTCQAPLTPDICMCSSAVVLERPHNLVTLWQQAVGNPLYYLLLCLGKIVSLQYNSNAENQSNTYTQRPTLFNGLSPLVFHGMSDSTAFMDSSSLVNKAWILALLNGTFPLS